MPELRAIRGPSTATMRKIWPARTGHARLERRGDDEPLDERASGGLAGEAPVELAVDSPVD